MTSVVNPKKTFSGTNVLTLKIVLRNT